MKEAHPRKMIEGDVTTSVTESTEHGLETGVERESDEIFHHVKEIDTSIRTISPVRPVRTHAPDFIHVKQRPDEGVTSGGAGHSSTAVGGSSSGPVTQEDLLKIWTLDKAPPPVKIHPEGEYSETSSDELSPPPSPKRKKDLLEKDNVISRPFSPIAALQQQDSI